MFKRKTVGVLLAGVLLAAGAGLLPEAVAASAAQTQLDTERAQLFLPGSYEQYLDLTDPVDIAVCEKYIAVAEQNILYHFDHTEEKPVYHTYNHAVAHSNAQISKVQFSQDKLFFSDSRLGFYELDLTNLDELKTTTDSPLVSLSTFFITDDTLFEASVVDRKTTYLSASLSSLIAEEHNSNATEFGSDDTMITPQLSYANGELYTAVGSAITVYSCSNEDGKYSATHNFMLQPGLSGLKSIAVVNDYLYYSVNDSSFSSIDDGLYRCDLATKEPELLFSGDGYGALTSYNGKLYAVKGNAVMEYSLEDGVTKTDYEISSASDSVGRLNTAKDIACTRDLLVVADSGNKRISIAVLNCEENNVCITDISVIPCIDNCNQPFAPDLIATDGTIIAVVSLDEKESCIYVYHIGNDTFSECFPVEDIVLDIVCVNGTCYYITESGYGTAADNCEVISRENNLPVALTADTKGNLYVVDQTGHVRTYTEEDFTDSSAAQSDEPGGYIHWPFTSLQTDGKGNFYYISDKILYMNETELYRFEKNSFVYDEQGQIHEPSAFVIDFQDNEVFLLYGNYIVMVPLKSSER